MPRRNSPWRRRAKRFAYTLMLSPDFSQPDGLAVIDVNPDIAGYSQVVHTVIMPNKGDEFHHFGWNACSSVALAAHRACVSGAALPDHSGHAVVADYIVDTKPVADRRPRSTRSSSPRRSSAKTGYSRPHTIHCGPEGIYISTLGGGGKDGTMVLPASSSWTAKRSRCSGATRWTAARDKHYDFWWNYPRATVTWSAREWAIPPQFEAGIVPEDLLANKYGHRFISGTWARAQRADDRSGRESSDGARGAPAHDPGRGVRIPRCGGRHHQFLEGSIWTWWRDKDGVFQARRP